MPMKPRTAPSRTTMPRRPLDGADAQVRRRGGTRRRLFSSLRAGFAAATGVPVGVAVPESPAVSGAAAAALTLGPVASAHRAEA